MGPASLPGPFQAVLAVAPLGAAQSAREGKGSGPEERRRGQGRRKDAAGRPGRRGARPWRRVGESAERFRRAITAGYRSRVVPLDKLCPEWRTESGNPR